MRLERHHPVERHGREPKRIKHDERGGEAANPAVVCFDRALRAVIPRGHPLEPHLARAGHRILGREHVWNHVGAYQTPPHRVQRHQQKTEPREHHIVRQPDRLPVVERVQLAGHVGVDVRVPDGENQQQPDQ